MRCKNIVKFFHRLPDFSLTSAIVYTLLMTTYIFTDGASKGNPGPGGWGAIIVSDESVYELGGGEKETTNNRMELTAALRALKELETDASTIVFSDSSYLVNGITSWIVGWGKNGWKTKAKKDVLNKDLWLQLRDVLRGRNVMWRYVPGHSGIRGNERANDIAESFAIGKAPALFRGQKTEYPFHFVLDGAPLDRSGKKSSFEKKQKSTRRATAAYSYVSLVDGMIQVHETWEECKLCVEGKRARFKKALSKEEEATIIKEFRGG